MQIKLQLIFTAYLAYKVSDFQSTKIRHFEQSSTILIFIVNALRIFQT